MQQQSHMNREKNQLHFLLHAHNTHFILLLLLFFSFLYRLVVSQFSFIDVDICYSSKLNCAIFCCNVKISYRQNVKSRTWFPCPRMNQPKQKQKQLWSFSCPLNEYMKNKERNKSHHLISRNCCQQLYTGGFSFGFRFVSFYFNAPCSQNFSQFIPLLILIFFSCFFFRCCCCWIYTPLDRSSFGFWHWFWFAQNVRNEQINKQKKISKMTRAMLFSRCCYFFVSF